MIGVNGLNKTPNTYLLPSIS